MGDTNIEWTEKTWNPTRGCTPIAPGCANCYATRQAIRQAKAGGAYEELVKSTPHGPKWTGQVIVASGKSFFVLEDVRELATPIPMAGSLGFFDVTPEIADQVRRQLGGWEKSR